MAKQLQLRRGNYLENETFIGAEAEMTFDTERKDIRIHDGVKRGGYMVDTLVDFQIPTADNGYTWYRKYASGWVEQGIEWLNAGSTWTLPVPMADTHYTVTAANKTNTSTNNVQWYLLGVDKTTTSITAHANGIAQSIVVYGIAA